MRWSVDGHRRPVLTLPAYVSDKVIYAYDFLSVRDRSVMLNSNLHFAKCSQPERVILTKKETERVNTHKMQKPRYRLSIERDIDHTSHSVKGKVENKFVPRLSRHGWIGHMRVILFRIEEFSRKSAMSLWNSHTYYGRTRRRPNTLQTSFGHPCCLSFVCFCTRFVMND
jgi:hypothetical protein